MFYGGLCFITDRNLSQLSVEESVRKILDAGVKCVQFREKNLSRREMYYQAESLRKITEEYKASFIVNDHCDIALAVNADGVHLGQDDLPLKDAKKITKDMIIGISTHSVKQAVKAAEGGADYIGFGPVYYTETKDAGEPKGFQMIGEIKRHIDIPLVAIGGIQLANLSEIFKAGADAVAVASSILKSDDVYITAKKFVDFLHEIS